MNRLDDLTAFVSIVEKGGQTAAARHLQRSLQSINRSLTSLERSVGVELVSRTTRRSRPTAAASAFYRRGRPALLEIADAKEEAVNTRAEPSGLLRIGAPLLFAPTYVAPVVCEFLTRNPEAEIDLKLSDRKVDLLEEGLDLAIRIRNMPDVELKARCVGERRTVVFGARSYFAKHGRPRHPDELGLHHCILRIADDPEAERWPLRIGGGKKSVPVRRRFRTDSAASASSGCGRSWNRARAALANQKPSRCRCCGGYP